VAHIDENVRKNCLR